MNDEVWEGSICNHISHLQLFTFRLESWESKKRIAKDGGETIIINDYFFMLDKTKPKLEEYIINKVADAKFRNNSGFTEEQVEPYFHQRRY